MKYGFRVTWNEMIKMITLLKLDSVKGLRNGEKVMKAVVSQFCGCCSWCWTMVRGKVIFSRSWRYLPLFWNCSCWVNTLRPFGWVEELHWLCRNSASKAYRLLICMGPKVSWLFEACLLIEARPRGTRSVALKTLARLASGLERSCCLDCSLDCLCLQKR